MPRGNRPTRATRERILETAELLFAEHGFYGVSLRELARAANVNVAAVNYHFGDMKALYLDLLVRRFRALNSEWLASIEKLASNSVPNNSLADILAAMGRPLFEASLGADPGKERFVKLLSRCLTEPLDFAEPLLTQEYFSGLALFTRAIRQQVKELSPDEFMWRFSFVLGALHHTLATLPRMEKLTDGICRNNSQQNVMKRFVDFSVAAFLAPKSVVAT